MTRMNLKTVYSASSISLVSIFQNILEGYGIKCWIKNEFLFAGIGEIPPIECWPLLCVNDEDYEEAKRIVAEALSEKNIPAWKCDSCGEIIEGQFSACWNCGKSLSL
jgi:YgiT-type zinc finger domain-containing protein